MTKKSLHQIVIPNLDLLHYIIIILLLSLSFYFLLLLSEWVYKLIRTCIVLCKVFTAGFLFLPTVFVNDIY